ncbi:sel1 repeat family protein [Leclercia adecarboxylata]|uniref:SEL1-like repeat protein n=1 Tax=Leclercia adecarboxylata TaxID=83655 RepID=UPI00111AAD5C|nr:DUF6396 domain-containing protein [Leclercia adecarboxylata]QCZ29668.1 sel1 repeat family protein [Leclercia adecarboxylata]
MKRTAIFAGLLLLAGSVQASTNRNIPLNPLSGSSLRLAFTCKHETIPDAPADTDVLFKYARWLQKNNQLKQDKKVDTEIARLYRIAAENGHYKASINLQNGSLRGQFSLSSHERFRLSQRLIEAGVAAGYYLTAVYLDHGSAGLKQDSEPALRYYRKAADEGNSQAQAYVGDKLAPVDMAPDIADQMRYCAATQGNGVAAGKLGVYLQDESDYQEALEIFQLGVAGGDSISALVLTHGFEGPDPDDELYYLGQKADPERARRYKVISKILSDYSYASPVVPEINDIVPLPPAPLPEWDDRIKWVEERKANVMPPKPSEALIAELARAKQLDPATGGPIPPPTGP